MQYILSCNNNPQRPDFLESQPGIIPDSVLSSLPDITFRGYAARSLDVGSPKYHNVHTLHCCVIFIHYIGPGYEMGAKLL